MVLQIALAAPFVAKGLSAVGKLFGGGGSKTTKRGEGLVGQTDQAINRERNAANQATENLANFDPQQAFKDSTAGAFRFVEKDLFRGIRDLRGSQVGMGRLRTGFAGTDEDELYRDIVGDFSANVARQGVQVGQQQIQKLGIENQSRDRLLEILSAEGDRETANKNAQFGFDDFLNQAGTAIGGILPFL